MHPDPLSLVTGTLFEIGESLSNEHPELVDQALTQSHAIERNGIDSYIQEHGISLETGVARLIDGLALRFFSAVMPEPNQ
jgi:hypothetical protein